MSVVWTIAKRYVKPRRFNVITLIGGISVLGIVIGTAALVIVTSLFNGFRGVARDLMIGFGPHIEVVPAHGSSVQHPDHVARILHHVLQETVGDANVTSVAESKMVVAIHGRTGVAITTGLENPYSPVFRGLKESIVLGTYSFHKNDMAAAVISVSLADQLQLSPGDTITVVSTGQIVQAMSTMQMPSGLPLLVSGIYQSNAPGDAGVGRMYCSYEVFAQANRNLQATILKGTVQKPTVLPEIRDEIQQQVQAGLQGKEQVIVRTWQDANQGLVDTMKMESMGSFIVLALIVLVASFNVLVSLTLGVVEKRRDIAVLQGMGLSPSLIRRIYLLQGLVIGVVSVVVGLGIGLLVCYGQLTFHWISFDMAKGYLVPFLPLEVHVVDILLIGAVGLCLASVAALYPATRAARTAVAEAIRVD